MSHTRMQTLAQMFREAEMYKKNAAQSKSTAKAVTTVGL